MSVLNRAGLVFARKWIAGTTVDDAIAASLAINHEGAQVMVNYLGEHLRTKHSVASTMDVYKRLLASMHRRRIKGSIAVKPTQLGLCISKDLFYRNYIEIAGLASRLGFFVWLDMEEHEYVDDTIDAYLKARGVRKNIGICIQAKLRRSFKDAQRIAKAGGAIRLVKGAYNEGNRIQYSKAADVDSNYIRITDVMLGRRNRLILATHDKKMVDNALGKGVHANTSFAMLKGVRWNLARSLIEDGRTVSIYVPFGEQWMEYSLRRLKELRTALLIARSIFQQ